MAERFVIEGFNEFGGRHCEMDELMPGILDDMKKPLTFLTDVQEKILKCYEIEKEAFQKLNATIK